MKKDLTEILQKAKNIKLILMDCDGVLTDGTLYFSQNGEEFKTFHVRDGQGIVNWHKLGLQSGIITGRSSKIVERRANELGMNFVKLGSINKLDDLEDILEESGLSKDETAYIGDDTPDIEVLQNVGLSFSVADAHAEVINCTDYTAKLCGGNGAVREIIDLIISAK